MERRDKRRDDSDLIFDDRIVERFKSRITRREAGCWEWSGHINRKGYGTFGIGKRTILAHSVAWRLWYGVFPDLDKDLHHVCENRKCVRVSHLKMVTPRDHTLKYNPGNQCFKNLRKTHCPRGHQLSPDNLVPSQLERFNRRSCLVCAREYSRLSQRARRSGTEFPRWS